MTAPFYVTLRRLPRRRRLKAEPEQVVMEVEKDKVDDAVLALLRLTLHDRGAWKGHDWDTLDRLSQGLIGDRSAKLNRWSSPTRVE